MKRLICLLLLVFAAGLCMPVMAEELLYGEREGWHFYPGHPTLSTILENDDFWLVRVVCTEKDTETNAAVPRYTCKVTKCLRGEVNGELVFTGMRIVDPGFYCGPNNGLTNATMQEGMEYILVLDRHEYREGYMSFRPGEVNPIPGIVIGCSGDIYSSSKAIWAELDAQGIDTMDDLEAFFRANLPEDTGWQKSLLIAGGAAFAVVWLGLMGWVLYKRKRNME